MMAGTRTRRDVATWKGEDLRTLTDTEAVEKVILLSNTRLTVSVTLNLDYDAVTVV